MWSCYSLRTYCPKCQKTKKVTQNEFHHYGSYSLQANKKPNQNKTNKKQTQLSQNCHWLSYPKKDYLLSTSSQDFSSATAWRGGLSVGNVFEVQLLRQDFCGGKDICFNSYHPSSSEVFLSPGPLPGILCHSLVSTFIRPWISLRTEAVFLLKSLRFQNALNSTLGGVQNLWCFFC